MSYFQPNINRVHGHNLVRALWQAIKLRELENVYLRSILFTHTSSIASRHMRKRAKQLQNYADFISAIACSFEEKIQGDG